MVCYKSLPSFNVSLASCRYRFFCRQVFSYVRLHRETGKPRVIRVRKLSFPQIDKMVSLVSMRLFLLLTLIRTATAVGTDVNRIAFIPSNMHGPHGPCDDTISRISLATSRFHNENTPTKWRLRMSTPSVQSEMETQRHPLFRNTNINSCKMPVPHPDVWKRSFEVSRGHNDKSTGQVHSFWETIANTFIGTKVDYTRHLSIMKDIEVVFDDPSVGARLLMHQCGLLSHLDQSDQPANILPETLMKEQETLDHLSKVLSYYQSIVSTDDKNKTCRARIVSSIGSIGTKCPRWHADHVPLRLVMSLLGPGCEYIPFEMETCNVNGETIQTVNRQALNTLEEDDTSIANEIIVPTDRVEIAKKLHSRNVVTCANPGDVVLLMGRGWEEKTNNVLAAVHRSPRLNDTEQRVLLTVDVVDWDYSYE